MRGASLQLLARLAGAGGANAARARVCPSELPFEQNIEHMVSAKLLTQLVIGYAVSLPLLFAYGTYFDHGLARTASAYGALLLLVILVLFAMFRHWLGKQRIC